MTGTRNCALIRKNVDLDSWEVSFSLTVNLLHTSWKRIAQHAALAASHCQLENHLVFYFNLLLIVYFLYSIKGTAFHRSLVCFSVVIQFIISVCRHSTSSVAKLDHRNALQLNHKYLQTLDQVSRHRLFKVE